MKGAVAQLREADEQAIGDTENVSDAMRNGSGDAEISLAEFESVPKSTRGRISLQQANEALRVIGKCIDEKTKVWNARRRLTPR
jgi:hypothetical protein